MSNNAHDLSNRLLNALDNNYNVVDMHTVNEIISVLEKFNITKELLETTRLGKHVNELRRKTRDPTLARRAKVLVKRWRDLVIPAVASPAHAGSNRASAERSLRRLGGTPLTSPALSRQVVSPAVPSPKLSSRPAWGGYESDSQDVILVDDDPPPPPVAAPAPTPALTPTLAPAAHRPHTPSLKRPPSPDSLQDDKKTKRDKKPKKRRGHSRAGAGTDAAEGGDAGGAWGSRNGTHVERRRNGCRRGSVDPYSALVNRIPKAGDKKVKTTKELLEQIQSRGTKPPSSPSPGSPASPDVMFIEPEPCPVSVESPLRNGEMRSPSPPLEDERPYVECTCGEEADDDCPAARRRHVRPVDVRALHCALLPGVNGTRAPLHPHQFAVRPLVDPDRPGLFNSVVPLYKYSDYADDRVVKNMDRVPLCQHLPWTEFAPEPKCSTLDEANRFQTPSNEDEINNRLKALPSMEDEVSDRLKSPSNEDELNDRLKAPFTTIEEIEFDEKKQEKFEPMEVVEEFERNPPAHRTVERTKEQLDGKTLYSVCENVIRAIPYDYSQTSAAPVVTLPLDETETEKVLEQALAECEDCPRDELGRPPAPERFGEWHECVKVGQLVVLPYVVID